MNNAVVKWDRFFCNYLHRLNPTCIGCSVKYLSFVDNTAVKKKIGEFVKTRDIFENTEMCKHIIEYNDLRRLRGYLRRMYILLLIRMLAKLFGRR